MPARLHLANQSLGGAAIIPTLPPGGRGREPIASTLHGWSGELHSAGDLELVDDPLNGRVAPLVALPGSTGFPESQSRPADFVQSKELPAAELIAGAVTADLPDAHDDVVLFIDSDSMNLDQADIPIVL
jgi:hypothetical protein